MADFLLGVLLPVTLAGGLFTLCCLALRPLTNRLRAAFGRAVLAVAMALFLLPLPLLASLPSATASRDTAPENTAVGDVLRQAAPTAAVYRAGGQLATALAERPTGQAPANGRHTPRPNASTILAAVWLAGVFATATAWSASYLRLMGKLRKNSVLPLSGCRTAALYGTLCDEIGLGRKPRLWLSDGVGAPLLAGVLRPRIILPTGAHGDDALAHAIRHELTHYRRRDLALKQLGLLVCALHWFNPAAWLLRRGFAAACEQSCDEAVAAGYTTGQRKAYADTLLRFAGPSPAVAVSAFASPKKQLHERMRRLMKPVNPKRPLRLFGVALPALLVCAALLAGCSLSAGALALEPDASGIEPVVPVSSLVDRSTLDDDSSIPDASSDVDAGVPESPQGDSSASGVPSEPAATDVNGGFICPVPDAEHISRLMTDSHRGVDFNAPEGTPIYAAAAGTVISAEWHRSYGYYIVIEHGNGLRTLYAHNATLTSEAGEAVQQGQQIATVGSSGNSTGSHCHLEMTDGDGTLLNPLDYISLPEGISPPS